MQDPLPKVAMRKVRGDGLLTDPLQSGHPTGGQMTVLQDNPRSLFDGFVDHVTCNWPLALTKGNGLGHVASHVEVISKLQQT